MPNARKPHRAMTMALLVAIILAAFLAGRAHATTHRSTRTTQPRVPETHQHVTADVARARRACPNDHPLACRAALVRAYRVIAWQRAARTREANRVLESMRGTQPFAYAAKLAYLACRSFSTTPERCRPPSEMLGVGRCESGLQSHDPNASGSTADGWMQFLLGTWRSSPAGQLGWSRYDVLAMGIAAEGLVHHDGSWREWSCGYAATTRGGAS